MRVFPSSVTLGGAAMIGDVQGGVLIRTGIDPSQQLLHVNIVNLDMTQLLKTIGKLIDVELTIPEKRNVFFVRNFDLYLSTGMELFDVHYPRGVRLEVDLMLFGKHATLYAEVSTGGMKLKGSIEKFRIGDLVVTAASDDDKDPYIDIELSSEVQKLKVDGKIVFMNDNWVMLLVEIDTAKDTFFLHLELVVGDALKIIVVATLKGEFPEAEQDRVKELEAGDSEPPPPYQQDLTRTDEALVAQQAKPLLGGQLEGKTFKVHAVVEQDIVAYLMKLANDQLGGERDPAEQGRLENSLDSAKVALDVARVICVAAKDASDTAVEMATKALDKHMADLKQSITLEQTRKTEQVAKLDQEERDTVLQAGQDERDLAAWEYCEVALAEQKARKAQTDVVEWLSRTYALEAAHKAVQTAMRVQETAEAELVAVQIASVKHAQKEPKDNSSEYEAWLWFGSDLDARVDTTRVNAEEAVNDMKLAEMAFDNMKMGSIEGAKAKLASLTRIMERADLASKTRRAAVAVNIAAGVARAAEQRTNLQKRRAAIIAQEDAKIAKMMEDEV
jgi:hypothetical protein